jgi:hypothetical protein
MNKSQMRVSPGFLLVLFGVLAIFGWMIIDGVPTEKAKIRARFIQTLSDERVIASSLIEKASKTSGLTNINSKFVLDSLITTNKYPFSLASRTNALGAVIDIWQTPFQIELVGQTNFVVRSAGPNKNFGDADDIIFNSASNDFVKP